MVFVWSRQVGLSSGFLPKFCMRARWLSGYFCTQLPKALAIPRRSWKSSKSESSFLCLLLQNLKHSSSVARRTTNVWTQREHLKTVAMASRATTTTFGSCQRFFIHPSIQVLAWGTAAGATTVHEALSFLLSLSLSQGIGYSTSFILQLGEQPVLRIDGWTRNEISRTWDEP